jgi:hypothetical protein
MSFTFAQSALVFGAALVCANTGVAMATAKAKAIADKTIFIDLLPEQAPAGKGVPSTLLAAKYGEL